MPGGIRALLQITLVGLVAGCASFAENAPREAGMEHAGYRYDTVDAATDPQRKSG